MNIHLVICGVFLPDTFTRNRKESELSNVNPTKHNQRSAMINPLSKRLLQFNLFTALNVILLAFHGSAIPKRDVVMFGVGLVACLLAIKFKKDDFILEKTKRFRMMFGMLTIMEVLVTLLVPWTLILLRPDDGYLLAPHLFVFQCQIALEGIFRAGQGDSLLVYYFTVIANLYRSSALVTWVSRTNADERDDAVLKLLPGLAIGLWICSGVFILFEWYPYIHRIDSPASNNKME